MHDPQANKLLDETFAKMSEQAMRAHGLEALCSPSINTRCVSLVHWRRALLRSVFPKMPIESGNPNIVAINALERALGGPNIDGNHVPRPIHEKILGFWAWMERAGYAISFGPERISWLLTEVGEKRLEEDDPCRPGILRRLRDAHDAEFSGSLRTLGEAHECFDHGLLRPTLTLLGLAYEDMLKKVAARFGVKTYEAAERITKLRRKLDNEPNTPTREAALQALSIAELTRQDRNLGGHDADAQFQHASVNELLTVGTMLYGKLASYEPATPQT